MRQPWGVWVVLKPKGQGKTQGALRLGEVWHQRHGYPVEGINLYHDDRPDFVDAIDLATLAQRMTRLSRYLAQQRVVDVGDLEVDEAGDASAEAIRAASAESAYRHMQRRVVVVDEASLHIGNSGLDAGRRLVRQVMAQARHLLWHVVYVGQMARQLPTDLFAAEAVFVRAPTGREAALDRREPVIQALWEDAAQAFAELRRGDYWERLPDLRAWSYVDCPGYGRTGYRGVVPFNLPGYRAEVGALVSAEADE